MEKYKNKIAFTFISLLILFVLGCSGTGTDSTKVISKEKPKSTNEQIKDIYALNEEVKLKDNILIVSKVEKSAGGEYTKPKDGMEFVIVSITIKNGGSDKFSYGSYDFKVQNSKGNILDPTYVSEINENTQLNTGELASKGEVSGTLIFEEPKNDPKLILEYKPGFWSDKTIKIALN